MRYPGGVSRRGSSLSILTNYSVGSTTTNQSQLMSQTQAFSGARSNTIGGNLTDASVSSGAAAEPKTTIGQIGRNVSSGSDGRYSQSGASITPSGSRHGSGTSQQAQQELKSLLSQSDSLQSQRLTFSPVDDAIKSSSKLGGRNTAVNSPNPTQHSLNSSTRNDKTNSGDQGDPTSLYSCKRTIKWKCFVKSVTSTHVIMCFVPASYGDLLLLSEGTEALKELSNLAKQISLECKNTEEKADENFDENVLQRQQSSKEDQLTSSAASNTSLKVNPSDSSTSNKQPESSASSTSNEKLTKKSTKPEGLSPLSISESTTSVQTNMCESNNKQPTKNSSGTDTFDDLPSPILRPVDSNMTDFSQAPATTTTEASSCVEMTRSVSLPVYVYNCPVNCLTDQIVNKWTCKMPADIYEDLRFVLFSEGDEGGHLDTGQHSPDDPDRHRRQRKTLSESEKWHLGMSEKATDDIYGNQADLKHHCTLISETFFRSFVSGKKSVVYSLK